MPGGKQSKRRRRAGRPAVPPPVQRKGQRRQASPRVVAIGTALLVLIVVAAILGFSFGRGGSSAKTVSGAADVQTLLKGIPQKGNVLGKSTAPATIVEYIDLQCPFCQQFETQALPTLIRQYVRTGKAKLVMRPIAFIGPDSQVGRLAAIEYGRQNKMFNLAQLLYLNQGIENSGWLDNSLISSAAGRIPGLDVSKLEAGRGTAAASKSAAAFDRQAVADAVQVTPTILVGRTGGSLQRVSLSSPSDAQSVGAAVNRALG